MRLFTSRAFFHDLFNLLIRSSFIKRFRNCECPFVKSFLIFVLFKSSLLFQEHIFYFIRNHFERYNSNLDIILKRFKKCYVKTQKSLLIVVENHVNIANALFESLDLNKIKGYKVEILVSKRIIFFDQFHKLDFPLRNKENNQLNYHQIIIIICDNLKLLFHDKINCKSYNISDFDK